MNEIDSKLWLRGWLYDRVYVCYLWKEGLLYFETMNRNDVFPYSEVSIRSTCAKLLYNNIMYFVEIFHIRILFNVE